jgi:serine protease Do
VRSSVLILGFVVFALPAMAEPAFKQSVLQSVVTVLPVRDPATRPSASGDIRAEERSGSGVVIRSGGYIATNHHVVLRAERVFVRLSDGREIPADVVGSDDATDIALLKVDENLPALPLGGEPPVGAPVCTASDPFGVGLSVTCGVVSAVRRSGMGFNRVEDFIQTDAVLNPGSSGGALVDGEGALVGLVAAIFTRSADANIGINFAISTALVMRVVDDLIAHGAVVSTGVGLRLAPLPRPLRRTLTGLRVTAVEEGDPADNAGLRPGDVITAIAGRTMRKRSDALTAIFLQHPGERIEVAFVREGKPATVMLEIPR